MDVKYTSLYAQMSDILWHTYTHEINYLSWEEETFEGCCIQYACYQEPGV